MSNVDLDISHLHQLNKQLSQARNEIHNLRKQLSTLKRVHQKDIEEIYHKLDNWQCLECRNKQTSSTSISVEESNETLNENEYKLNPIGVINTNFPEKRCTPRQPGICKDLTAKITLTKDIFTNPKHALDGLQEFSHMWILFYFDKNYSKHNRAKVSVPRLNGIRSGVFATRSPHRPCPIGLSLVKIGRIMDNIIYFSGVDMIDQTPVLDIKPYIPQYDNPVLLSSCSTSTTNDFLNESVESLTDLNISQPTQRNENRDISSRVMDGQENQRDQEQGEATTFEESSNGSQPFIGRNHARIGEREAPDGEEEEAPTPNSGPTTAVPNTSQGHVRVPSWITQAPVSKLTVCFKDRALAQFWELGSEGEEKKTIITNVLQEDPRSVYLRERWGSHCYVFRIAELCVSCKFNDDTHTVTVYQIFQNDGSVDSN